MEQEKNKVHKRMLTLVEAISILFVMFSILGVMIIKFKMVPQIPILFVFTILMFYGHFRGYTWDDIFDGIVKGIVPGIIPIIIFLMIGLLVSTWLASGTIATMMVIGFHIISVDFFLPTVFLVCSLIGITVGSAFTTISTMGVAFMGIGHVLGLPEPMIAGAIVSGAFLGNNMSPLSDTSNLTTGIAKVDLYVHLKNMAQSSIPAGIISIIAFFFMGNDSYKSSLGNIALIATQLSHSFWVSGFSLIPIIVLLLLAWRRVPAIPTLLVGAISAIIMIFIKNPNTKLIKIDEILMNGYKANTGSKTINLLTSGGGIMNMLPSISLIICALSLGGLLIGFGVVDVLIHRIKQYVNTPGKLILLTALSGIGINFAVGEQYLSILLPGTAFKGEFDRMDIDDKYLSRTLATAGADINALVPWGVSSIFISGTLGINALNYIPYAIYPYLNPLMTVILGFTFVTWEYHKKRMSSTG